MKKTLLLLTAIILSCNSAFSQGDTTVVSNTNESRVVTVPQKDYFNWVYGPERWARTTLNEFNIGYGLFTPFTSIVRSGMVLDHKTTTGLISVGYMRYLKFGGAAFGASFGFEHVNATYVDTEIVGETENVDITILSFVPSAKFLWFNLPRFSIYTQLNAGVAYYLKNDKGYFLPSFQLDLLCSDFGGERIRGFAELGWGTQHILNLGVKVMF